MLDIIIDSGSPLANSSYHLEQIEFPFQIDESYWSDDQNDNYSNTSPTAQPVSSQETKVNESNDQNEWDNIADVSWLREQDDQDQYEEIPRVALGTENNVRVALYWQNDQSEWEHFAYVFWQPDTNREDETLPAISSEQPLLASAGPANNTNDVALGPENNVRVALYWQNDQSEWEHFAYVFWQPDTNREDETLPAISSEQPLLASAGPASNIADLSWLHDNPTEEVSLISTLEDQYQPAEISQVSFPLVVWRPENNVRVALYWQNDQSEWEHFAYVFWQPETNLEDETLPTVSSEQPLLAIEGPEYNINADDRSNDQNDWNNIEDVVWQTEHNFEDETSSITSSNEPLPAAGSANEIRGDESLSYDQIDWDSFANAQQRHEDETSAVSSLDNTFEAEDRTSADPVFPVDYQFREDHCGSSAISSQQTQELSSPASSTNIPLNICPPEDNASQEDANLPLVSRRPEETANEDGSLLNNLSASDDNRDEEAVSTNDKKSSQRHFSAARWIKSLLGVALICIGALGTFYLMGYFKPTPVNDELSHVGTSPAEIPPEEPGHDDSPSPISPFYGIPLAAVAGSMFQHLNTCTSQPHQNGKRLLVMTAICHAVAAAAYFSTS